MAAHAGNHFVLLLSDGGSRFRALYSFDVAQTSVEKLTGVGPSRLRPAMVKQYLKYNSGSRSFVPIATKGFTVQSDAVVLKLAARSGSGSGRGSGSGSGNGNGNGNGNVAGGNKQHNK